MSTSVSDKIKITKGGRGSAKINRLPYRSFNSVDVSIFNYIPRKIHAIMGIVSHNTLIRIHEIEIQEKFRSDPRFPIFQMKRRNARYQKILTGIPYKPIFEKN